MFYLLMIFKNKIILNYGNVPYIRGKNNGYLDYRGVTHYILRCDGSPNSDCKIICTEKNTNVCDVIIFKFQKHKLL